MSGETSPGRGTVLLGYDGSSEAAHAIARAGELFPRRRAVLVHAWSPFRNIWNVEAGWPNIDDGPLRLAAARTAKKGLELARAAGFDAVSLVVEADEGIPAAIADAAADSDAEMIVVGSRGQTGLRSLLLGSVSRALTQCSRCPVVVIPSPALADARTTALAQRQ
jgi:nucleotide-binding universal stress UspA family protein